MSIEDSTSCWFAGLDVIVILGILRILRIIGIIALFGVARKGSSKGSRNRWCLFIGSFDATTLFERFRNRSVLTDERLTRYLDLQVVREQNIFAYSTKRVGETTTEGVDTIHMVDIDMETSETS